MTKTNSVEEHIVIIGGGYTGLTAALELSKTGKKVSIIEKDSELGGLARAFDVGSGIQLERFYHHWFTNDKHIIGLVEELGLSEEIIWNETKTGMYYSNNFYKLSSPIDLLQFNALSFINRIRLGILIIKARFIKNWKQLEKYTAEEWLISIAGIDVYKIVWEPLLTGKFGEYKDKVSAVWIWNKLKLRGGSRNKKGGESLAYFKGGFAALTTQFQKAIEDNEVNIILNKSVNAIQYFDNKVIGVSLSDGESILCNNVISTVALPIAAKIFENSGFPANKENNVYLKKLNSINYLGNICLVLVLNKSLSNTYWTNVNDANFPFVAVIEHTNLEPVSTYMDKHIVYLSKYLPVSDKLYMMTKEELIEYSMPYITKMFPEFCKDWIVDSHLWKEGYSQPVVTCNYSEKIPAYRTPISGIYVSCMAQIYPEDRGTNYAVMQGKKVAKILLHDNIQV